MKNTQRRLQLDFVPVNGSDDLVSCGNCPSACCRAGVAMPLTRREAEMMAAAGTDLEQVTGRHAGIGRKFYHLLSDCANLVIDPESGEMGCRVYGSAVYPRICADFKTGGFSCVGIQLSRIATGEDTHEPR